MFLFVVKLILWPHFQTQEMFKYELAVMSKCCYLQLLKSLAVSYSNVLICFCMHFPSFPFFVSSITPPKHPVLVFIDSPTASEVSPPKPEQGMSIPVIGSSKCYHGLVPFFLLGKHTFFFFFWHSFWFHSSNTCFFFCFLFSLRAQRHSSCQAPSTSRWQHHSYSGWP